MRLLLDTQTLLWWLADDERLPEAHRTGIADTENEIHVSAVTAWEIVIKSALGKLTFDGILKEEVRRQGFDELPVTFEHAAGILELPAIHRDPFDRMLVSQARIENLQLLTTDEEILRYPVSTL